jgi:hypothetical protein
MGVKYSRKNIIFHWWRVVGWLSTPPLMKYLYFLLPAYVIKYQFLTQLCNSFLDQTIIMLISSNGVPTIYFQGRVGYFICV